MNTLINILMVVLLCVAIFTFLATTVFRKRLGHDVLGWHDCGMTGFDGVSATGVCKYCGKKCLMDSQGNWFTLDEI